jgi:LPS-assembly lipoprotein
VVVAVAVLSLPGCDWQPVYGGAHGDATGPASAGFAETSVALIPERSGQLLRQALQTRFDRGSGGMGQRYELTISGLAISGEPVAIQRDNTTSRVRLVGVAPWALVSLGPQRRTLVSGQARVADGYNVIDQQYFASDLESEAVQHRMIDALAEQITLRVATYFRQHQSGG